MNWKPQSDLFVGAEEILCRGTADVLEEDGGGVFLYDRVSGAYVLAADSAATGIRWLQQHEQRNYRLFTLFSGQLAEFVRQRYGMTEEMKCVQAVYGAKCAPEQGGALTIRPARENEIPTVLQYYSMLSGEELRQVVLRGNLFLGCRDGELVGFVGEHLEGSMGLLEVLPGYRRCGYGEELERYMIARQLGRGRIPYCQIVEGNAASLALQKKLGLNFSEGFVYWLS